MKKIVLVLIFLFTYFNFILPADTLPSEKSFDMYFLKRGTTHIAITDENHDAEIERIDFEIWDKDTATSIDDSGQTIVSLPTASFGIVWDVYREEGNSEASNYNIFIDFNSSLDKSGNRMLISSGSQKLNYKAEVSSLIVNDKNQSGDLPSNSVDEGTDARSRSATLNLISNEEISSNSVSSGSAIIKLTMIPSTIAGDNYFMDGEYTGYVILSLETN